MNSADTAEVRGLAEISDVSRVDGQRLRRGLTVQGRQKLRRETRGSQSPGKGATAPRTASKSAANPVRSAARR